MIAKWLFDRTVALVGLVLAAPLILYVALLIRIKMPGGPVIFKQERVGRNGKLFTLYKFRSMVAEHSGTVISIAGEKRITPLGAKLRRYKLDEIPQLWNVLIGDMSFVGPRPDVKSEIDKLTEYQKGILAVRPGITSPASIKYDNEEQILAAQPNPQEYYYNVILPDKIEMNLQYIQNWTFCKDLACIFNTIF